MKHFHHLIPAITIIPALLSCSRCPYYGERTEPLDNSLWEKSEWISAADADVIDTPVYEYDHCRAADGASWFVSDVTNGRKVVSARWMTAGLGVYDIYVNGKLIGEEVLKPGFTHPVKTKRSFTYDVTDAIKTGKGAVNRFSACLTPGWWADKVVSPRYRVGKYEVTGMTGKKCAFRGVLELTYNDGTTEVFGTDSLNWKAGVAGPVTHAAIFDGEEYDARIAPGYNTVESLGTPEINREFNGEILPTDGAEVYMRHDLALAPVKAYVWQDVEGAGEEEYGTVKVIREYAPGSEMEIHAGETLVIDFGQNCAAVPEFVFNAAAGTVLTCLPSEILNDGNGAKSRGMDGPEGSCHRLNLRTPDDGMILKYTFAESKKPVSFIPRRTFFGFRYISVTATDNVLIKKVSSVPVTSIAGSLEAGTVITGNEDINKLISNTVWGQRSNYLSVPTDCPQRNERLGWTADTQVFTETGTFFANTDAFFHKWMRDMRDSQGEKGGFPGVAPTAQYGGEFTRVGWSDAGIIVPWTIWKQYGDNSIVDENWDAMMRLINHLDETKYDHNALIDENKSYEWADWLSYEPLESCSGRGFTKYVDGKRSALPETITWWNCLNACYWAIDAGMMKDMATATGRDALPFAEMEERAKDYIRTSFLNTDGTFKLDILNTMQTPALFVLKLGLFEAEAKDNVIARLRKNFEDHGNCLQTGFLGTSILMKTLTDNGMVDIAYELLFQRKNPSWLYSVDNGATTIWERWNSYTIENGMGPKGMNSFNHYAYGCVCQWIWETAAGIAADINEPGFGHIIMAPVPDRRLGSIRAEYKSAAGLIRSEWKYEGDNWKWSFTVPEGATASVTLPDGSDTKEYASGTYKVSINL